MVSISKENIRCKNVKGSYIKWMENDGIKLAVHVYNK